MVLHSASLWINTVRVPKHTITVCCSMYRFHWRVGGDGRWGCGCGGGEIKLKTVTADRRTQHASDNVIASAAPRLSHTISGDARGSRSIYEHRVFTSNYYRWRPEFIAPLLVPSTQCVAMMTCRLGTRVQVRVYGFNELHCTNKSFYPRLNINILCT